MLIAAALPIVFSAVGFVANLLLSKKESAPSNTEATPAKVSLNVSGIASRYDVNNISPSDMAKMSRELFDSGAISFQDHAFLSSQSGLNSVQSTENSAKADEPRDYVAQLKMQLTNQQKAGARPEFLEQTQRALHIMEALAALKIKTPDKKLS